MAQPSSLFVSGEILQTILGTFFLGHPVHEENFQDIFSSVELLSWQITSPLNNGFFHLDISSYHLQQPTYFSTYHYRQFEIDGQKEPHEIKCKACLLWAKVRKRHEHKKNKIQTCDVWSLVILQYQQSLHHKANQLFLKTNKCINCILSQY